MASIESKEPGPKFQGSLDKQGRMPRTWKKYWFILKDDELTYVKNQDKTINNSQIDMSTVQTVRSINGKYGYPFEVVTKNKTHYLSAVSIQLRDKWIKVLHDSMAWCGRRSSSSTSSTSSTSRLSSTNNPSSRGSCNSVRDEPYSGVPMSPSSRSDHRSSGYGSTTSRLSDLVNGRNQSPSRDSGAEDVMFANPNHAPMTMMRSRHEELRRVSAPLQSEYMIAPINSCTSGDYESVFMPEDFKLTCLEDGYANVNKKKAHSDQSNANDQYASVHESANISISHIVQGYANVKRNTGPKPDQNVPEEDGVRYNDVFDPDRTRSTSSVVMRRSAVSQSSHPDYSDVRCEEEQQRNNSSASYLSDNHSSAVERDSGSNAEVFKLSNFAPIGDLPHARLELMHKTSFDDIRQFLASNRGPTEYYPAVNRNELDGRYVKVLKEYLATRCY